MAALALIVRMVCFEQFSYFMFVGDQNTDEHFEVINLSEVRNAAWFRRMAGDIQKASAAKQMTIGGVSGWYVSQDAKHLCHTAGRICIDILLWTTFIPTFSH
jgi:hypothetical protein